jgi:23S rRNA pseudouridine1911/1915/1917 synthase
MEEFENEEEVTLFERHKFIADKGQELMRLDKYLMHKLSKTSRTRIQACIDLDMILVNQKKTKAGYKVKPLDEITISLPTPPPINTEIIAQNIPIEIVYEDDDLLLVNKKAGMVVHPAHANWDGTLINALLYHFQQLPKNKDGRPGLVHRIDKDTSGLLVVAKTEHALTHLAKQFFNHSIERTYYALVWGIPKNLKGTINVNLARSQKDRRIVEAYLDDSIGKKAITHYEVLEDFDCVSLIKCNLETGRTHQIRAHLKYLGHPLFSDAAYGGDKILRQAKHHKFQQFVENCFKIMPRQALHAKSLGFLHPTKNTWFQFETELPQDFKDVLEKWRKWKTNYDS